MVVPHDGLSLLQFKHIAARGSKPKRTTTKVTAIDKCTQKQKAIALALSTLLFMLAAATTHLLQPEKEITQFGLARECDDRMAQSPTQYCALARGYFQAPEGTIWLAEPPLSLKFWPHLSFFRLGVGFGTHAVGNSPTSKMEILLIDRGSMRGQVSSALELPYDMCAEERLECARTLVIPHTLAVFERFYVFFNFPAEYAHIKTIELKWVFEASGYTLFRLAVQGALLAVSLLVVLFYMYMICHDANISTEQYCSAVIALGSVAVNDPLMPLIFLEPSHLLALASTLLLRLGVTSLLYSWIVVLGSREEHDSADESDGAQGQIRKIRFVNVCKVLFVTLLCLTWQEGSSTKTVDMNLAQATRSQDRTHYMQTKRSNLTLPTYSAENRGWARFRRGSKGAPRTDRSDHPRTNLTLPPYVAENRGWSRFHRVSTDALHTDRSDHTDGRRGRLLQMKLGANEEAIERALRESHIMEGGREIESMTYILQILSASLCAVYVVWVVFLAMNGFSKFYGRIVTSRAAFTYASTLIFMGITIFIVVFSTLYRSLDQILWIYFLQMYTGYSILMTSIFMPVFSDELGGGLRTNSIESDDLR